VKILHSYQMSYIDDDDDVPPAVGVYLNNLLEEGWDIEDGIVKGCISNNDLKQLLNVAYLVNEEDNYNVAIFRAGNQLQVNYVGEDDDQVDNLIEPVNDLKLLYDYLET
jgi:hypothetical protein